MGEAKHTTREGKLKPRDFTDLDASLPQLEPCSPSSTLTTASLNPCLHLRTTPTAFPELLVPPPSWLERSVYYEDVLQGGGGFLPARPRPYERRWRSPPWRRYMRASWSHSALFLLDS